MLSLSAQISWILDNGTNKQKLKISQFSFLFILLMWFYEDPNISQLCCHTLLALITLVRRPLVRRALLPPLLNSCIPPNRAGVMKANKVSHPYFFTNVTDVLCCKQYGSIKFPSSNDERKINIFCPQRA